MSRNFVLGKFFTDCNHFTTTVSMGLAWNSRDFDLSVYRVPELSLGF